jgi:TolB protein
VSGWLIFSDLPFRLAIIQTDGKGSRNILENTEFPERVKVSPDGQWIAFISNTSQLYLVRPDGSELKQLTFSDEVKTSLSWSPNGEAIVYSQTIESEDQFEVELFVYEIHTFQIHQLTDTPGVDEFAPVYSPDGETIAFTSPSFQDETQPLTFRPMLIDVSGGNARPLLDIPTGSVDMLAWSPNGNQIVFTSGEPGLFCDTDLYVVNTDGSDLLRLTDTSDQDIYPTWSPDGQWIAFTRSPCNDAGNSGFDQIFIAHANGLGLRQLTNEKNLTITGLSWFPQPTLQAGATVTITELGADLNLRSSPSLSGPVLAKITEGANILILAGPVEADSYLWWRVRLESGGVEGWVADNPGWFMTDE